MVKAISISALMTVIKRHNVKPVNGSYKITKKMKAEALAFDRAHGHRCPPELLEQYKQLHKEGDGNGYVLSIDHGVQTIKRREEVNSEPMDDDKLHDELMSLFLDDDKVLN
jgi:hypothetical protein